MQRIRKVLIANRGEIACRVARTCRRLGLAVATVHSVADRYARHVREIGESVEVGAAPATESYLDVGAVVAAARRVGADAVHPGYGFLSENPAFVRALEAAGLIFVGPSARTIERVGGKASAKAEAARLGLPVVPGSAGGLADPAEVAALVRSMNLPVLLKAVAGGGGRGMAVIATTDGLEHRIESAMREADKAFGSGELIVERYLERVRHLEVQIAGDGQGHAIHLFERECTLQRRHQKVVEEAPAAGLPEPLRAALLRDACRLAEAVGYRGLGTVEFVVSGDEHFFLEVNPRLQVEHPVTEAVTGLDLVELQLRIADDGRLPVAQRDVRCEGHAFEARICAEDPDAGFVPVTGRIELADFPAAPLRVESGVESGDEISPHYDSMVAKLIAHGADREQARRLLLAGLQRTTVIGLATNLGFLREVIDWDETRHSSFHTRLIDERWHGGRPAVQPPPLEHLCAASLAWLAHMRSGEETGCWTQLEGFTGWRLLTGTVEPAPQPALLLRTGGREWPVRFSRREDDGSMLVAIGETVLHAALRPLGGHRQLLICEGRGLALSMLVDPHAVQLTSPIGADVFECTPFLGGQAAQVAASGELTAPMMGKVVAVKAAAGERVAQGATVVVLESMKMELHVTAPFDGTVDALRCAVGQMVARGAVLAQLVPAG